MNTDELLAKVDELVELGRDIEIASAEVTWRETAAEKVYIAAREAFEAWLRAGVEPKPMAISRSHDLGEISGKVVIDSKNGFSQHGTLVGPVAIEWARLPPKAVTFTLAFRQDAVGGHVIQWTETLQENGGDDLDFGFVDPRANWRSIFTIHSMPSGLWLDPPNYFEP